MPASQPLAEIRLLVYDLDGTLLDAFEDIWRSMNRARADLKLEPLPFERVRGGVGDGAHNLVKRCLDPGHAHLAEALLSHYMHHYSNNPDSTVKLYPGVADTLRKIRNSGIKQAILTNKPEIVTRQSCDALGIGALVDGVWGATEGGYLKPHPESLLRIVRHFGVTPQETAMVGDYQADFDVARAAGTKMIGVTWGLWTREQVEHQNPDAMLGAIEELPPLLVQTNSIS